MNEELFGLLIKNYQTSIFLAYSIVTGIVALFLLIIYLDGRPSKENSFLIFIIVVIAILVLASITMLIMLQKPSAIITEYLLSKNQYTNSKDLYYEVVEVLDIFKKIR
jgi:hypothetical protein